MRGEGGSPKEDLLHRLYFKKRTEVADFETTYFMDDPLTGSILSLLQYSMTLRQGPKDPVLPTLIYSLQVPDGH